jgi:hypothetical protein
MQSMQVGKDLTSVYWEPGNGSMFLDLVQQLTGKPLLLLLQYAINAGWQGLDVGLLGAWQRLHVP